MKNAKELASDMLDSPESHARRATSLRRLGGGISAEAGRRSQTGLSDEEARTLQAALGILEGLAAEYQKAGVLAQSRRDGRNASEREVRAAMQKNFRRLTSIADRVALIAAVQSYRLRSGGITTMADVRDGFDDAIDSLESRLAEKAIGKNVHEVVAEAWSKFEANRIDLAEQHAILVEHLEAVAKREP